MQKAKQNKFNSTLSQSTCTLARNKSAVISKSIPKADSAILALIIPAIPKRKEPYLTNCA